MSATEDLEQRVAALEMDVAELRNQVNELSGLLRDGLVAVNEELKQLRPPGAAGATAGA
jgi:uncharacterized coiled-coil protein SlyX